MTYPNPMNRYEVKGYQKERANKVRRDVQRLPVWEIDPGKERGSWVKASLAFGVLLPAGLVLVAVFNLIT